MNPCCCGHGEQSHANVEASVPLVNPTPIYPVTQQSFTRLNRPNATYTQNLCHCGCSTFEPLD